MLPIGDNFVMGIDDAAKAVEMLKPRAVIPMHYNTREIMRQDPTEFTRKVGTTSRVVILEPGQSFDLAELQER